MSINRYHVINEYYLTLREVFHSSLGVSGYMKNTYFFDTISENLKVKYGETYKPSTIKKYLEHHKCSFLPSDLKRYNKHKVDISIALEYQCLEEQFSDLEIYDKVEKKTYIDNIMKRLKLSLSDYCRVESLVDKLYKKKHEL